MYIKYLNLFTLCTKIGRLTIYISFLKEDKKNPFKCTNIYYINLNFIGVKIITIIKPNN